MKSHTIACLWKAVAALVVCVCVVCVSVCMHEHVCVCMWGQSWMCAHMPECIMYVPCVYWECVCYVCTTMCVYVCVLCMYPVCYFMHVCLWYICACVMACGVCGLCVSEWIKFTQWKQFLMRMEEGSSEVLCPEEEVDGWEGTTQNSPLFWFSCLCWCILCFALL
jgi:hypothetical protein